MNICASVDNDIAFLLKAILLAAFLRTFTVWVQVTFIHTYMGWLHFHMKHLSAFYLTTHFGRHLNHTLNRNIMMHLHALHLLHHQVWIKLKQRIYEKYAHCFGFLLCKFDLRGCSPKKCRFFNTMSLERDKKSSFDINFIRTDKQKRNDWLLLCRALHGVMLCEKENSVDGVSLWEKNRFVRHQIKATITSSRFHICKLHKKKRSTFQKVSTNNRRIFDNMQRMPNDQTEVEICHGIPTELVSQQTNKKHFAKLCTETFGWICMQRRNDYIFQRKSYKIHRNTMYSANVFCVIPFLFLIELICFFHLGGPTILCKIQTNFMIRFPKFALISDYYQPP